MSGARKNSRTGFPPRVKSRPEWEAEVPPNQQGQRVSREEAIRAVHARDRRTASREGYYALEKKVWLNSEEQAGRPDKQHREVSADATFLLTHEYVLADLARGRKSMDKSGERKPDTTEALIHRKAAALAAYVKLAKLNPNLSHSALCDRVGKMPGIDRCGKMVSNYIPRDKRNKS